MTDESESASQRKALVIVAIGDSLTAGYQLVEDEGWVEFAPYTVFLDERLRDLGRQDRLEFRVYNKGVLGERTDEMLARFDRDVLDLKPDFVIVLGGTNDIGQGFPPDEVFRNLVRMYDAASKCGIVTIACSIPSISGCDSLISPRVALNEMIRAYCVEKGLSFVDLFRATSDSKTGRLVNGFSSDGIHLSLSGYKKIADTIFDEALEKLLLKYLSKSK